MARKTPFRDVLITQETHKGDNGHQNPIGEFKTLKRYINKHLTRCGGSLKTLRRDNETTPTPER